MLRNKHLLIKQSPPRLIKIKSQKKKSFCNFFPSQFCVLTLRNISCVWIIYWIHCVRWKKSDVKRKKTKPKGKVHLVSWRRKIRATHNFKLCTHFMNHLREAESVEGNEIIYHSFDSIKTLWKLIASHVNLNANRCLLFRWYLTTQTRDWFSIWINRQSPPIAAWNMTHISRSKQRCGDHNPARS